MMTENGSINAAAAAVDSDAGTTLYAIIWVRYFSLWWLITYSRVCTEAMWFSVADYCPHRQPNSYAVSRRHFSFPASF